MPEEVVKALRWQNHPNYNDEHDIYAKLLYVSKQLLRSANLVNGPSHSLSDELLDGLHLTQESALEVLNKVISQKDELSSIARGLAG